MIKPVGISIVRKAPKFSVVEVLTASSSMKGWSTIGVLADPKNLARAYLSILKNAENCYSDEDPWGNNEMCL